jgi:hypothetical protein
MGMKLRTGESIKHIIRERFGSPLWVDRVVDWKLKGEIVRAFHDQGRRAMRNSIHEQLMDDYWE